MRRGGLVWDGGRQRASLEIPLLVRVQFMAALYRANEPCLFSGERVPWCVPCMFVITFGIVAQRMLAARSSHAACNVVVPRRVVAVKCRGWWWWWVYCKYNDGESTRQDGRDRQAITQHLLLVRAGFWKKKSEKCLIVERSMYRVGWGAIRCVAR